MHVAWQYMLLIFFTLASYMQMPVLLKPGVIALHEHDLLRVIFKLQRLHLQLSASSSSVCAMIHPRVPYLASNKQLRRSS